MTTLVIDIGNARIKWALARDGQVLGAVRSALHAGAEDRALATLGAELEGLEITRMLVANVADEALASKLDVLAAERFAIVPRYVQTAAEAHGVCCGYADPARLGVDRWVAVIEAHRRAGPEQRPACVITAGTALTFDAVTADGAHLGGLIFPGPRMTAEALARSTRRIGPTTPVETVPTGLGLLGRSTEEAVGHAAMLGPAAAFDRAVALVAAETTVLPLVLLAGGDAERLRPWLATPVRVEADLVLAGLAFIAAEAPRKREEDIEP